MKPFFIIAAVVFSSTAASAQYGYNHSYVGPGTGSNSNNHYVAPYTNRSGDFHPGHYQTSPNSTPLDNYGTNPNINPYSGQYGTRRR
jgi:hypothetical protein